MVFASVGLTNKGFDHYAIMKILLQITKSAQLVKDTVDDSAIKGTFSRDSLGAQWFQKLIALESEGFSFWNSAMQLFNPIQAGGGHNVPPLQVFFLLCWNGLQ